MNNETGGGMVSGKKRKLKKTDFITAIKEMDAVGVVRCSYKVYAQLIFEKVCVCSLNIFRHSIANVGIRRGAFWNSSERQFPVSRKSFLLLAQQAHQHDDRLIAGRGFGKVENRGAIGIGAGAPEQAQFIQGLRCLSGLIRRRCSRGNERNH